MICPVSIVVTSGYVQVDQGHLLYAITLKRGLLDHSYDGKFHKSQILVCQGLRHMQACFGSPRSLRTRW
jgi:hypothetical protein